MSAHQHQCISDKDVQVTFGRDFRTGVGTTLLLIMSAVVLIAPAGAQDLSAKVKLYNKDLNQVGTVRLTQQGGGNVAVHVRVHDLPAGFHGFHVHAVGQCDPGISNAPDFASAKGHFDLGRVPPPTPHRHKDHSGDFPVLLVNSDGMANARFNTDRFDVADLFDADGRAIIIHANPDNYTNIPNISLLGPIPGGIPVPYVGYIPTSQEVLTTTLATGDAGGRIACGVVEKVVRRDHENEDEDEGESER